jgi:hypothetical protein
METPAEKRTGLARLRDPFPPEQINKLPKPTISNDEWKKLPKATCKECGGYHATSKTVHLDFVGHAALTARLLEADEAWTWDFLSLGPDGYPVIDKDGGMWIKLTVCGVTRLGYGDAQGKTGGNAMKERIGDAMRNAAMRFGAALDLWHKGEAPLFTEEPGDDAPKGKPSADIEANAACAELIEEMEKADSLESLAAWAAASKPQIDALPEIQKNKVRGYYRQVEAMLKEKSGK